MTSDPSATTRTVHPRRVWGGLVLAVLGLMVVAAGIVATSWAWAVPGLVLLVVGVVLARAGGVLADTTASTDPRTELEEVVRGGTRAGAAPGARLDTRRTDRAAEVSREADRTRRELLEAAQHVGRPNFSALGSGLLLVACGWLTYAQWSLYPMTSVGQDNALRDLGVTLVVALAALRTAVSGPRVAASAVAVAGGVALVLFGLLMPHGSTVVAVDEVVCGVLVVVGGVAAGDRSGVRRAPEAG